MSEVRLQDYIEWRDVRVSVEEIYVYVLERASLAGFGFLLLPIGTTLAALNIVLMLFYWLKELLFPDGRFRYQIGIAQPG